MNNRKTKASYPFVFVVVGLEKQSHSVNNTCARGWGSDETPLWLGFGLITERTIAIEIAVARVLIAKYAHRNGSGVESRKRVGLHLGAARCERPLPPTRKSSSINNSECK